MFAISGGQGNFTAQDYIDQNFGIDILTRLISKESKVIKSLQDRGVTGSVLGSTKFFRGDYKLSDEDEFGKIYKQIKAELEPTILKEVFEFPESEIQKNAGCLAKSSFQINKAISFESLLRILGKINILLNAESMKKFTLNKVLFISRRGQSNRDLISSLENALIKKLFSHCTSGDTIDFDFCHPNFDEYLTADSFKVFKGATKDPVFESNVVLDDANEIFGRLKQLGVISIESEQVFFDTIDKLTLVTYDSEGKRRTWKKLINHLHGEIELDGKTYFFIDSEWYEIRDEFVKELNEDCKRSLLQTLDDTLLPEKFTVEKSENEYSTKYINRDGCIILDKITPENIEFCDILKYTDDRVYVIHLKKGFNNSMRELTAQALVSARRLAQDIKTDKSFLKTTSQFVRQGNTKGDRAYSTKIQQQTFPAQGLEGIFANKKDRDIIFCLGIMDTNVKDRNLANQISEYKSNIAKFSILELERNLRGIGFGFAVAHIKQE